MKKFTVLVLLFFSHASYADCQYSLSPQTLELGYTAFKTTKKLAVKGKMPAVKLMPEQKQAETIQEFLKNLRFEIDVMQVSTGDLTRDQTLKNKFFALLSKDGKLKGKIKKVTSNSAEAELMVNGKNRLIRFALEMNDSKQLKATSRIDMIKMAMTQAYESLHQACEQLHTGEDGVSKTWTDVEIEILAQFDQKCS